MSMTDLERAIEMIETSNEGYFHGPATEDRIIHAQQTVGLSFPPTYKRFLSRLGCGSIFGEEFYGLVGDGFENSCVPDAIWATLDERRRANLPSSLIVVGATGDGGLYAIDVSQKTPDGESPVVEWWLGSPPYQRIAAEDFGAFLWQSLRTASTE